MIKQTTWVCTQRSLWSTWASAQSDQSSLSAWRNLGSLTIHWAHSKDSDQTVWMPRLIWVFPGCTLILLVLSCRSSNLKSIWAIWWKKGMLALYRYWIFKHTRSAAQRDQRLGSLICLDSFSRSFYCVSKQWRLWRDCAYTHDGRPGLPRSSRAFVVCLCNKNPFSWADLYIIHFIYGKMYRHDRNNKL